MKSVFLLLLLVQPSYSLQKIGANFKTSSSNNSSTVTYWYSGDDKSFWSSEVSLTGNRSKVKEASGKTEITREAQWINTWDLASNWFIELGTGTSNTRINKIRTGNLDFTFGKTFEEFLFLNWSLNFGTNNIKQTEGRTASAAELQLQQSKSGAQIGFEPTDWISVSFFSNQYRYDKNVDQQILLLQSEAAVQRYGLAFSDQLSSLIEKEIGLILGFQISDSWKLHLNLAQTTDAPSPHVKGSSVSAKLSHKFSSSWDGNVLIGSNHYDSTATTPSASYGFFGLGAAFSW